MEKDMDMESLYGITDKSLKDSINLELKMGSEFGKIPKEMNIKVNGS